jgi:hypothetical protein
MVWTAHPSLQGFAGEQRLKAAARHPSRGRLRPLAVGSAADGVDLKSWILILITPQGEAAQLRYTRSP